MNDLVAKPAPRRVAIEGRYVRLEPMATGHADTMFTAVCDAEAEARHRWLSVYPPADVEDLRDWIAKAAISKDDLYFAVVDRTTGRCGGRHALMRQRPEHGSVEIGGVLWGEGIARTRLATEAFYLTARYVFDDLRYRRFEWKCNDRNEPSKAAARRFGFRYEGLFRQDMIVKGENRDTAWFSIIDGEWPALRAEYERWLAPENFAGDGTQKSRLDTAR